MRGTQTGHMVLDAGFGIFCLPFIIAAINVGQPFIDLPR